MTERAEDEAETNLNAMFKFLAAKETDTVKPTTIRYTLQGYDGQQAIFILQGYILLVMSPRGRGRNMSYWLAYYHLFKFWNHSCLPYFLKGSVFRIKGRDVHFDKSCGGVLDATFHELCDRALWTNDYLKLTQVLLILNYKIQGCIIYSSLQLDILPHPIFFLDFLVPSSPLDILPAALMIRIK